MKLTKKEIDTILLEGIEKFKELVKEKKPEYLEIKKRGWCLVSIIWKTEGLYDTLHVYPTKKEAKMALAMCELLRLRDEANGEPMDDWCKWDGGKLKYYICSWDNKIESEDTFHLYQPLSFKTKAIRDKFLTDNEPLIKKAFGL